MINAVGITAEYNPLHYGHMYHMKQARALSGCDAVVVAMSGNFVQRGEPALFDKWTRAEHALRCGADLVIEIPVLHCLSDAGGYASAGVRLLESLGCTTHIAFGSESGNVSELVSTAEFLNDNKEQIDDLIRDMREEGMSYPRARALAYERLGGCKEDPEILSNPNDILAIEYIRSMKSAAPVAIARAGAGYGDGINEAVKYQSASGIRDAIRQGTDIRAFVQRCVSGTLYRRTTDSSGKGCPDPSDPQNTYDIFSAEEAAARLRGIDERLFDLVRYAIISTSVERIEDCPSGGEGLAGLLKLAALDAGNLDELIHAVKSKRYTYTRISRLLMQVLLGISRTEYYRDAPTLSYNAVSPNHNRTGSFLTVPEPEYIRVLGFNDTGRKLLSQIKREESAALPAITNINKERNNLDTYALRMLELDTHAVDIFNLITGSSITESSDYRKVPVII